MNCTTAGNIVLALAGGGSIELPIAVGWNIFPFAAVGCAFPDTGAGTVSNLS